MMHMTFKDTQFLPSYILTGGRMKGGGVILLVIIILYHLMKIIFCEQSVLYSTWGYIIFNKQIVHCYDWLCVFYQSFWEFGTAEIVQTIPLK